ncbi:cytochrome c oxidase accessory protein CcoG [Thalassotalea sp. PLHSN55]|uniref:cytochrome c oxidase accessory protein CcoG n=1 Tax=Thalassotalea sp. PLHSN55 TaxID=3435888 RepID=UPI003F84096F
MKPAFLSKDNLIVKVPVAEDKIYIREQNGHFQRIRRVLSFVLIALFIGLPFVKYRGAQAVFFDLSQQQFHLFSLTLFPQDLVILSLVFILAAFLLLYVTKFYGRVWCGFTCPQTVWMLMFNWVERRVEGSHNQSRSLDKQAMSTEKVVKKVIKHTIWLVLSLITSLVFISYFVTVEQLYLPFFSFSVSSLVFYWVLFFALCTYVNGGWIREKMCLHMCPYARIQSAMFDQTTKLVSYDATRGEGRGMRKRNQEKPADMGDCVDCNLCVQVCPVGIDIRDGLQYECINCALCIDACDMTMTQFNYDKGLITFQSEQATQKGWQRHIGYGSCVTITLVAMLIWAMSWQSFDVNIIRDRQALYRINQSGDVENSYVFKIRNKSQLTNSYQIKLTGLAGAKIIGNSEFDIMPGELTTHTLAVTTDVELLNNRDDIQFTITELNKRNEIVKTSAFYSGAGAW